MHTPGLFAVRCICSKPLDSPHPDPRTSLYMKYGKNNNSNIFDYKEDCIRKSSGECPANISMYNRINEVIS